MSRTGAAAAVTAVLAAILAAPASPASRRDALICSKAAALRVLARTGVAFRHRPDPVEQVLCGPFTGPGSVALAVVLRPAPDCQPVRMWGVFRFREGAWQTVVVHTEAVVPPLVLVGGDLRETVRVSRPGDPRCAPSGGTSTYLWHWQGDRLTPAGQPAASPPPAVALPALEIGSFYSPDRKIWCGIDIATVRPDAVWCGTRSATHTTKGVLSATLRARGRVTVCNHATKPAPRCNYYYSNAPTLKSGQQDVFGGFRCVAARGGVTCTVARQSREFGRGFRIDRARVTRIHP